MTSKVGALSIAYLLRDGFADLVGIRALVPRRVVGGHDEIVRAGRQVLNGVGGRLAHVDSDAIDTRGGAVVDAVADDIARCRSLPAQGCRPR